MIQPYTDYILEDFDFNIGSYNHTIPRMDAGFPRIKIDTSSFAPILFEELPRSDESFGINPRINTVFEPIVFNTNSIFELPPVIYTPMVLPKPVLEPQIFQDIQMDSRPLIQNKTISFTVKNSKGVFPYGANIAVNGVPTAITDKQTGKVTLNVYEDALITISHVGYDSFVAKASELPSLVILNEGVILLDEVNINVNKKPKSTSNNWLLLLAGAVGAFGIYKYSKSGVKVVKAKI